MWHVGFADECGSRVTLGLVRCGLRYARSRAKKEGGPVRRRKDKVLAAMSNKSEHSPSISPVNMPFNNSRRGSGYDENASTPGPAGNEGYPPTPQHGHPHSSQLPSLNGMKSSPSPPLGSSLSYTPYQQPPRHPPSHHEHHPHQHQHPVERGQSHYSQPFYSSFDTRFCANIVPRRARQV